MKRWLYDRMADAVDLLARPVFWLIHYRPPN